MAVVTSPAATDRAPSGRLDAAPAPRDIRLLARGGGLGLVGVVVSGALQLLLVAVVARGLGAHGAGLFLEAVAIVMILGKVAELGASTGLVRTVSAYRALGRTVALRTVLSAAFLPVVGTGFVMAVAVYALAPQIAGVFFDGTESSTAVAYVHLFALAIPLSSLTTVALSAARGFGTMVPYVSVQNIALPTARLLLVVVAIAAGLGTTAVALGWLLPLGVACVVAAVVLLRLLRLAERSEPRPSAYARSTRELASEFWRFAAPRGLAGMMGITVTWMDVLLVGALRSTREAGIYAAASRLGIAGAYAMQAVGMVIAPRVSALLARHQSGRVEGLYHTATWWLMALSWPVYVTLAVFAPLIMEIFGPGFATGADALVILSLAMLVNLATGNVTTVLLMGGRSSWNLLNAGVSLLINVGLNVVLTPRMGITGAALAWAASIVFVNVAPLVQVGRFMGLRAPFGRGFWIIAAAASVCYGALGVLTTQTLGMTFATLAAFLVVATLLYGASLWRFRLRLGFADVQEAFGLVPKEIR
jgi:O-antigen/teichoic acid export membrane protein